MCLPHAGHIIPHATMGQAMWVVEAPHLVGPPPKDLPVCQTPCRYQMAASLPSLVAEQFGANNPMLAPDASLP